MSATRRHFLRTAAGSAAWACGSGGWPGNSLPGLPAVSASETRLDPRVVRFGSGIEPLVTLLEETPRDKLLEAVAARIRSGTSYREVLAALQLASLRNVQPRPAVGFKFHAVLVVNSAHLASLASPDADRWLPIFWALDYFKTKQHEEAQASGWKMPAVDEALVPSAREARARFVAAMDQWEEPAADGAVTGLVRTSGSQAVWELLFRYGARDYRAIGHKAIYVANSLRTLGCIGWDFAEPVLRSLTMALLNHQGEPNPATNDLAPDRSWRTNRERAAKIAPGWLEGRLSSEATRDLLAAFRTGTPDEVCDRAVEMLQRGTAPQSVWDAVFVGSGELLMRQPGIIGLHTLTTANALRFAYDTSGDDETRRLVLLQACAFLPQFRESARKRGALQDLTIDAVQPVAPDRSSVPAALEDIFADVSRDRPRAAAKTLSFLKQGGESDALLAAARRFVFLKGNDPHDYKFSSAVLEDYARVSPEWRDLFLALSVFNLCGSGGQDSSLVARTRSALRS